MSPGVLRTMGRCDGVGSRMSLRHRVFRASADPPLSLKQRLDTPLHRGVSAESWLDDHPSVRDAVNWEHAGFLGWFSASTNYRDWPDSDKRSLDDRVEGYARCEMEDLTDPPVNRVDLDDDESPRQVYSEADAKDWYLSIVAHSLAVEMGRWVRWSLTDYAAPSLINLLDSRSLFRWRADGSYEIDWGQHGPGTPARPRWTWEFVYENDLLGGGRLSTIGRALDWCRWNMTHFYAHRISEDESAGGMYDAFSMGVHWDYRGFPPARRVIEGTTRAVDDRVGHFTGGCHGTVAFLRSVLRTVNIPAQYLEVCGHGLPRFLHVERYLSHGDDPYNQLAQRDDLPIGDLLIDKDQFDEWFGFGADACENIGRGVDEAVAGLP